MRSVVAFAAGCLLLAPLSACGDGDGPTDPTGTWVVDREKTRVAAFASAKRQIEDSRRQLADMPPEMREKYEAQLPKNDDDLRADVDRKTNRMTFELELRPDKTSRVYFKGPRGMGEFEESSDGTWTREGSDVSVTITSRGGAPVPPQEATPQRFLRRGRHLVLLTPKGEELFWLERK